MPKRAKELSALDVKRAKHNGCRGNRMLAVGGISGLQLQITPANGKTWILRAMVGTKRREIGLGGYPDVTLAQARERARSVREEIANGNDPVEQKRAARAALAQAQAKAMTFWQAAGQFLPIKQEELSNPKHAAQWRSTLETYVKPFIGDIPVSEVTTSDVLNCLRPIWLTKTDTATKVRGRVEAVLSWAKAAGYRGGENPAAWKDNLDKLLSNPSKITKKQKFPAIQLDDATEWFRDVREGKGISYRALELLALSALRSGSLRNAQWSHINFEKRLWVVPAEFMKDTTGTGGEEHRVPLTEDMLELLSRIPRQSGSDFIFTGSRGPISDGTIRKVMVTLHEKRIKRTQEQSEHAFGYIDSRSKKIAVPHGLRSTFRDWVAERTGFPREMAEIALAHTVGSEVERAYRRSDMVEKRRNMMKAWGDFLNGRQAENLIFMTGS
ncbi:hypothetical protein BMG00_11160 [Thioclava marina]|uniref:Tyr recombinase domain-containing protein n=1 Tax=Thioclava marina TaxID=1915077 RepID=A0ABX3MKY8_9RHOB|nr:site-specific integrase [Thioclava marina]OOY12231.1 hypothetical protein BMG00_11160 [Thioclava marina]